MDTDKERDQLKRQFKFAKEHMEQKRAELDEIVRQIRANPNRTLCKDKQAGKVNMELSRAIQSYMLLELKINTQNPDC